MYIDQYTDAIKNCRFCFMCRHLSGIGNVMFTEADTPRIRAAMLYGVTLQPEKLANKDFIDTLYRSDLSAACRYHCVSHFDENGLNIAARADIVETGVVPDYVKTIADKLLKTAGWSAQGAGKVVYFNDLCTASEPGIAAAFDRVMKASKTTYQTVTGGCIGKVLYLLGFQKEAKEIAAKFAKFLNGLNAETIIVSNPAAYDALVNDYKAWGIKISARIMHTSEWMVSQKMAFPKKAGNVYYLESDFLRNYNQDYPFPKELLQLVNAALKQFGTNNEESYSCGEGAVVLPEIDEKIVKKLAQYVATFADDPAKDLIVVASPYTKRQLAKYTDLKVKTLEELAADSLS